MAGVFSASSPPSDVSFLLKGSGTAVIGVPGDADAGAIARALTTLGRGLRRAPRPSTAPVGREPLPGTVQREEQASLAAAGGGGGRRRCQHLLEGDGQGLTSQWTVGSTPPQVASAWSMY